MAILPTDLSFVLSGGTYNDDPLESLGGLPSATPIPNTINNLFKNITAQEASNGKTDYKCIYVFNDSTTDTMYNMDLRTRSLSQTNLLTPTQIYVGGIFREEIQLIKFTPVSVGSTPPEGGSFMLSVDNVNTSEIEFTSTNTVLASRIQSALMSILEDDISVSYAGVDTDEITKIFSVTFTGVNKNKAFGTIVVLNNSITPTHTTSVSKSVIGSPINTVTVEIDEEKTVPSGITFTDASVTAIMVGSLRPNEGFPLWIKRIVPPLANNIEDDGIRILCKVKNSPTL